MLFLGRTLVFQCQRCTPFWILRGEDMDYRKTERIIARYAFLIMIGVAFLCTIVAAFLIVTPPSNLNPE